MAAVPLESRPTSCEVVQALSRPGQPGEVQDRPPSLEISMTCHSPTAMQRPLSCGPRPMHGPLGAQRRLAACQVRPASVVCSTRNGDGWVESIVACDQNNAWTPDGYTRNPPNRPISELAATCTPCQVRPELRVTLPAK